VRIAAVYCVYNEEDFIECSIRSIYDFVDKVFVLLGEAPWAAHNPRARELFQRPDATEEIVRRLMADHPKIQLVKGVWNSGVDHRNAGMRLCHKERFNYYFMVDGDEVYRTDHLERIREELRAHPEASQVIVKCHVFWRSFLYRFPSTEMSWLPRRIFKVTRISRLGKSWIPLPWPCRFTGINKTDAWGSVYRIPEDRAVFYHFSYSRSPEKLRQKVSTFMAAPDIIGDWFERVWLRWPGQRDMSDLHPTNPKIWRRAVYHDLSDLPEVMRSHPYYEQEIITKPVPWSRMAVREGAER